MVEEARRANGEPAVAEAENGAEVEKATPANGEPATAVGVKNGRLEEKAIPAKGEPAVAVGVETVEDVRFEAVAGGRPASREKMSAAEASGTSMSVARAVVCSDEEADPDASDSVVAREGKVWAAAEAVGYVPWAVLPVSEGVAISSPTPGVESTGCDAPAGGD